MTDYNMMVQRQCVRLTAAEQLSVILDRNTEIYNNMEVDDDEYYIVCAK